jgi:glucans biosynthesis protein C
MIQDQRLHSLDNLRAVMMWLGVVLHVSMNHFVGDFPAPWRDKQTTLVADLILAFIHAFRMPVFFVIAGFFVALLVAQRGAKGMLVHRMRRLALPFVFFWPILFLLTIALVAVFMHQMIRGTVGIDLSIVPKPPSGAVPNTLHLWFLYMLIWLCIATFFAASIKNQIVVSTITAASKSFNYLISNWHGVFILTIPLLTSSRRMGAARNFLRCRASSFFLQKPPLKPLCKPLLVLLGGWVYCFFRLAHPK